MKAVSGSNKHMLFTMNLSNAMILLKGKPETGSLTAPETGFHISEDQKLDESIGEQMSQVYQYLNNIILVINQHGTILNNVMHREQQAFDPMHVLIP